MVKNSRDPEIKGWKKVDLQGIRGGVKLGSPHGCKKGCFLGEDFFPCGTFFFLPGLRWLAKHVVFFFGGSFQISIKDKYIHISSRNKKTTSVNKEIYNHIGLQQMQGRQGAAL